MAVPSADFAVQLFDDEAAGVESSGHHRHWLRPVLFDIDAIQSLRLQLAFVQNECAT